MTQFSFGSLAMPDDWQVQLQVELIEPARVMTAPLAKPVTKPPTNIVIRRIADATAPMASAAALLQELQRSVVVHHQPAHDIVFDDGAVGAGIELSFQSPSQAAVVQRHWFRHDAGVLTHLCATATSSADLGPLEPLMRSFRPS